MERIPVLKMIAQTKKQIRAIELVVLVRVDDTLRFASTRVRSRLRKLRNVRPAVRKGSKRPRLVSQAA